MNFKQLVSLLPRLAKYNFQVIFAGRFGWFLLASFALFLLLLFQIAWENQEEVNEGLIYELLFVPSLLLVFYPAVFGIQNDADARILELLFGIPNYKYKVWAVRLAMIYVAVFCILLLFSAAAGVLLYPVRPLMMAAQLMFPVVFFGNLSFMFSTIIRNGNGTAVVTIILFLLITILTNSDAIDRSFWNVLLNPFSPPRGMIPALWESLALKNRLFLLVGSLVCMMVGLLNLQQREKFL
ncbi:MAG: hypothetical protein LBS05_10210 [Tannerellaceae bacterium]|jgi:hypothetical protein|nr:hypothetical protein [Tannerellaceae bacterium]